MKSPTVMPTRETAIPDRVAEVKTDEKHYVSGNPLAGPFPEGFETAMFAMGCFWGPEPEFWELPGIWVTAVGYSGGFTANPTYKDVKSGGTGHAEVVRLIFDPRQIGYEDLLQLFWERHNPTSGMKQGIDEGTQYRSAIYYYDDNQRALALETRAEYQGELTRGGFGQITTEILPAGKFYFAEADHQAYFAKNPTQQNCIEGTGCTLSRRAAKKPREN